MFNVVNTQAFKLALLRHYISVAFMDEVKRVYSGEYSACVTSNYFINKNNGGITVKSLCEGMIDCIEMKYVSSLGVNEFPESCFGEYKSFLDGAWYSCTPRISHYGFTVLAEICEEIKMGRLKKSIPNGWVIPTLEDIFTFCGNEYNEQGTKHE